MILNDFLKLKLSATECDTQEDFLVECGGSFPREVYDAGPERMMKATGFIVAYANEPTFRTVINATEVTQHEFSEIYHIPLRSVESWCMGERTPTSYLLDLLACDVCNSLLHTTTPYTCYKISDMNGSDLRKFLLIDSVCDGDPDRFDRWDRKHPLRDFYRADERRAELIDLLIQSGFSDVPENIEYIVRSIRDDDDRMAIAEEVVTYSTHAPLWDSVSEVYEVPEDYSGMDAYIEAARLELVANMRCSSADLDSVAKCFTD